MSLWPFVWPLLLNVQFLNAQSSTINVKGVVNDAMGPVIGASVVEKGNATNGTITDIDGNFSLKVRFGCHFDNQLYRL